MKGRAPFLLDPTVVYLNHGAFGACPRPVFDVYQRWQREFEREPIDLFERRLEGELRRVRTVLGNLLGAPVDDLALVLNTTGAMNAILRSLPLEAGDETLTTRHEYGAIDLLLAFVSQRTGACVVRGPGVEADEIWSAASPRTRVLVASHVTTRTARLLPVGELCRRAREAGVLSVIDGAQAPGQVPLDLRALGADFYAGNCHKWLYAPKGAGFLYARPDVQALLEPLVRGLGLRRFRLRRRRRLAEHARSGRVPGDPGGDRVRARARAARGLHRAAAVGIATAGGRRLRRRRARPAAADGVIPPSPVRQRRRRAEAARRVPDRGAGPRPGRLPAAPRLGRPLHDGRRPGSWRLRSAPCSRGA